MTILLSTQNWRTHAHTRTAWRGFAFIAFLLVWVARPAHAQGAPGQTPPTRTPPFPELSWKECDEFIPYDQCKVTVQMADKPDALKYPHAHWDVAVKPNGTAVILLENASPFLSCTLSASPSPPGRDLGSAFSTFLQTVGTLGAAGNPVISAQMLRAQFPNTVGVVSGYPTTESIDNQLVVLAEDLDDALSMVKTVGRSYSELGDTLQADWLYSFSTNQAFRDSATTLWAKLNTTVDLPIPNLAAVQIEMNAANEAMAAFHRAYDGETAVKDWLRSADQRIGVYTGRFNLLQEQLTSALAVRAQFKQARDFLTSISDNPNSTQITFDNNPNYTTLKLPMAYYANKQVAESITCKDVLTQSQAFDAIAFTAFYENLPRLDLSAGALISLNHGHQVGAISGPCPSIATCQSASPSTVLAVTSYSRVQWTPGAFFEFHPGNFKCPWATNGALRHYFGYVCSFGLAFGLIVNPNNAATSAEYFEGISFGIQRVVILIGNHTGRYQEFTEGYAVGETVPAGTTPPTYRYWTNHPAFGISYRIPLR